MPLLLLLLFLSLTPLAHAAPSPSCTILSSPVTLRLGVTSPNVLYLQKLLNLDPATQVSSTGPGSPGQETTRYGPRTTAAVKRLQEKYKADILTPAHLTTPTGFVGPATRKKLASLYCSTTPPPTATTTPPTPLPPDPSGATGSITLDAPCTIDKGYNSCLSSISWTTTKATTPTLTKAATVIAQTPAGSLSLSLPYGPTVFTLLNGSTTLDSKTLTPSCAPASSWNGIACVGEVPPDPVPPPPAKFSASGIPFRAAFSNNPIVDRINAKSGDLIENVHIVSNTGPCIYLTNNVKNVTIRNSEIGPCKDASGAYREGVFSVDGSTNIIVRQNVIHDVNTGLSFYKSIHPIYIDHNNFYNIQGPFPQGKSVGFDWVTTGTSGSKIMCNLSDMQGMVYPATKPWGVEDHISMWHSLGLPGTGRTEVAYNRIRGGISKSGSAMQLGDGGGGNFWAHDNTVVNVGGSGIPIVSGENSIIENNRIFSDGVTNAFSGVGIIVNNYYPGSVCRNNTIRNNKVYTWNSGWYSPPIIENYASNRTCDEGLVVTGNSFNWTPSGWDSSWGKDPGDPTLTAAMFDEEYVSQCSSF